VLTDAIRSIPDTAFNELPAEHRAALLVQVNDVEGQILAQNFVNAQSGIQTLQELVRQWITSDYPVVNVLQVTHDELTMIAADTVGRLEVISGPVADLVCDVDGDHDVDLDDLRLIRAANGQFAAPGDRRDGNGDGSINVADFRYCQLRMTPK